MIAAATESAHAAVAEAAPPGVEVRVARPGELDGVEFLVLGADDVLGELASVPSLRVVQVLSAGTDWVEASVPAWATLCNARGARDVPVAEWVVGALLGAAAGLLAGARRSTWVEHTPVELAGTTIVVLGYGSIGEEVARRLAPFDVTVGPVGRRQLDDLPALLPDADAVVVLAPLTDATRGMVDAGFLGRMKDGAVLVNAGRGALVRTGDLLAELRTGRLRAALDVTDPEPLPAGHPLWSAPNVLITPHVGALTDTVDERSWTVATRQIAAFAAGRRPDNLVAGDLPSTPAAAEPMHPG